MRGLFTGGVTGLFFKSPGQLWSALTLFSMGTGVLSPAVKAARA